MNPKDRAKDIQIDNVVNNQEDDIVDLEIDDWLTMDSWGNTPAVEEMILIEFENL